MSIDFAHWEKVDGRPSTLSSGNKLFRSSLVEITVNGKIDFY